MSTLIVMLLLIGMLCIVFPPLGPIILLACAAGPVSIWGATTDLWQKYKRPLKAFFLVMGGLVIATAVLTNGTMLAVISSAIELLFLGLVGVAILLLIIGYLTASFWGAVYEKLKKQWRKNPERAMNLVAGIITLLLCWIAMELFVQMQEAQPPFGN